MGYITKAALTSNVEGLLKSHFTGHLSSSLTYLFSVSRILKSNAQTEVDLYVNQENKKNFVTNCEKIISIDDGHGLVWLPIQQAEWDIKKNKSPWDKGKQLAKVIHSNLISIQMERGEEHYPKKNPLLSFSNQITRIDVACNDSLYFHFGEAPTFLLDFIFISLREYKFKSAETTISDILDTLIEYYGVAGDMSATLIRDKAAEFSIDLNEKIDTSATEACELAVLLKDHIPQPPAEPDTSEAVPNESNPVTATALLSSTEFGKIPSMNEIPVNLLLKGVPGTGKSHLIDGIIKDHLELPLTSDNVKRLNVHSASDNTSFMQGVGVSLGENDALIYSEKRGEVLKHLMHAIRNPKQPFVLVLEEIQENSLNELIGDLIYLIEPNKRIDVAAHFALLSHLTDDNGIIELLDVLAGIENVNSIRLPSLVESADGLRLVFPQNLYVFCTTNYRDDKKIIEDNLLRRFDVIDLLPKTSEFDKHLFENDEVRVFLDSFNQAVLHTLGDSEPHPDRFMVGHARFMKVSDKPSFYRALKKIVDEFKEIRDVEFSTFAEILNKSKLPNSADIIETSVADKMKELTGESGQKGNYVELINLLQSKSEYAFTL